MSDGLLPYTPKLFLSYSWSSSEHEQRVLSLAEELMEQGIEIILDKWDLKTGHDAFAFMEQMVSDPTVTKVLIICDRTYSEKANARSGGAGTEAQIITPEIYTKKEQDKYAAVVIERDEEGHPYLPTYYKGRIFIDFSDASIYPAEFEKLVRWAWDKPLNAKPSIGKPPSFITEDDRIIKMGTSVLFRRALDAIRQTRPNSVPATNEYLRTVVSEMEKFRIAATPETTQTFDEEVIRNIDAFLPYRNELIEIFMNIASYAPHKEMAETLHRFFEQLMPFYRNSESANTSYHSTDLDNFKFIIHELFLSWVGTCIKHEKFTLASFLMDNDYYFSHANESEAMHSFAFFREHIASFEYRNRRLKSSRLSLRADTLYRRATGTGLDFKYSMAADFVLYLRSQQNSEPSWWPDTLLYARRLRFPFEVFARAKSASYFERVKPLLGVRDKVALEEIIASIEADSLHRLPRWEYESINPRRLLNLDAIATTS
jgi:hypothetical protein